MQELGFDVVWRSGRPVATFRFKPQNSTITDFSCIIEAYQKDQADKKINLTIMQREQIPVSFYPARRKRSSKL